MVNKTHTVTVKVTDIDTDNQVFKLKNKTECSENKILNNFLGLYKFLRRKRKSIYLLTTGIILLKCKHYK